MLLFFKEVLVGNGIDPNKISDIAISSVVPALNYSVRAACVKYFDLEPLFLQAGVKTGLKIKTKHPSDVGSDLIDFIVDTTPTKQNKFTPGKHIPVLPYERFLPHPDVSVLFAWNHKKEIMAKEADFKGEWITHLYQEYE